ncbi:FGGAP repeat domain containing protein [Acanthamoeba castellanii str. Neff]|uniref:FGGAP repeat domain containing protein n=1 Tax=Acanthamoeba castellanii (strain ATCC 30010 / Neff) TaxID=1257118 RepID=L8GPT4_ACACF|nr:FGGAP repeat domain containing protein [Acanthamoeba castellanii str. Neff]ELR14937.1 FGGAP repeat domain containing protein [Acanthamoeba castellanii str. Neff]
MKQKDVAILFLATLAILLSVYYQGTYHGLRLVWVHPIDASLYENGHFPLQHERLPPPLITDVDGDGHNEVIVVTSDSRIKILEGTPSQSAGLGSPSQWHNLPVKEEASLLPSVGVGAGRRPVALSSGYLSPYQEGLVRTQVIVVLTSGWTVLLFDNHLKLLWESTVRESLPAHLYHSEAALLVVPTPVRIGDAGVVIAAARLSRKANQQAAKHDHGAGGRKASWMANGEEDEDDHDLGEEHFSYFAFDGRTGALRWKHEAGDFYDEYDTDAGDRIGEERAMHLGEMSWNDFRYSVMQQLPHAWFRREDTGLRVAHFERGAKPAADTTAQSQLSGLHVDVPGLVWGGHAPHSEDDFVHEPNVIVAHFADGVEVIHLYTGRPVTRMGLERSVVWDDINGDGVVEAVRLSTLPTAGQSSEDQCWALGQSGVPPQEDLFNVSICEPKPQGFLELLTSNPKRKSRGDTGVLRATNPISIARPRTWAEPNGHKDMWADDVFLAARAAQLDAGHGGRVGVDGLVGPHRRPVAREAVGAAPGPRPGRPAHHPLPPALLSLRLPRPPGRARLGRGRQRHRHRLWRRCVGG